MTKERQGGGEGGGSLAERAVTAYERERAAGQADVAGQAAERLADLLYIKLGERVPTSDLQFVGMLLTSVAATADDAVYRWGGYLWTTTASTLRVRRSSWTWFHRVETLASLGELETRWALQQAHLPFGGLAL